MWGLGIASGGVRSASMRQALNGGDRTDHPLGSYRRHPAGLTTSINVTKEPFFLFHPGEVAAARLTAIIYS